MMFGGSSVPPSKKRGHDLVDLAAMLEPDGGMPGSKPEIRAARTAAAILAFVAEGHTAKTGAFRGHVARLVGFLKSLKPTSVNEATLVTRVLDVALSGQAVAGEWLAVALRNDTNWRHVDASLRHAGIVS